MTLHIRYTHHCASCSAFYIPFAEDTVCPQCGTLEGDRHLDFVRLCAESATHNLRSGFNSFAPAAWIASSDADRFLWVMFHILDDYRKEMRITAIEDFLPRRLKSIQLDGLDYLRGHFHDLILAVWNHLQGDPRLNLTSKARVDRPPSSGTNIPLADQLIDEGDALRNEKEFTKALDLYQDAIEAEPTYQSGYLAKALVYSDLERYPEAIEVLQLGLERVDTALLHELLGCMYSQVQRLDSAITHLNAAIGRDPRSYLSLMELSNIYLSLKDTKRARALANQALTIREEFPSAACLLGRIEGAAGNYRLACEQFGQAVEWSKKAGEDPSYYVHELRRSIEKLRRMCRIWYLPIRIAKEIFPNLLGHEVHSRAAKISDAQRRAKKLMVEGDTLLKIGRRDDALRAYHDAVEADPTFQPARVSLDALYNMTQGT